MQKTQLTVLIDYANSEIAKIPPYAMKDSTVSALVAGMNKIKEHAIMQLSKEKEDMINCADKMKEDRRSTGTEIFQATFTQYKP